MNTIQTPESKAMPEPLNKAAVQCSALFAAFVEYDKSHDHILAANSITLFSDGSGGVQTSHCELFEFHSFQEGIEKLKAANKNLASHFRARPLSLANAAPAGVARCRE